MSSTEREFGCESGAGDTCGCAGDCGAIVLERNRYFTGKLMTPRDFEGEQEYFLSRHRLHNRLLHGCGIARGLDVEPHPNPDRAYRWVVVRAGIAIDCCGRELVLPKDTPFELPLPLPPGIPTELAATDEADENHDHADPGPQTEPFLICLRYAERKAESIPALYAEATGDPTQDEANRVRELACLDIRSDAPECWRVPRRDSDAQCRDREPTVGCIEPVCPCGGRVPLALILFDPDDPARGYTIDLDGRRLLPPPANHLTHIKALSWEHGGEMSISDLRNRGGRLDVRFDRALRPGAGDATGINSYTFVVRYGGIEENLRFLPSDPDRPPSLGDDCQAVFTIDARYLAHEHRQSIAGASVYVTLKCDFILDCHGNPVSGTHLRGRLPSGDDRPGGNFESWFRVVPGRTSDEG